MITLPVAVTLSWACFIAALLLTIYGFYIGQVGNVLIPIGFCFLFFFVCLCIFIALSSNLHKWQRKKQIGQFVRRRNCMMIGFAAVFLISMVGKVVSFYLRNITDTNPLSLVLLILAVYFGFTFTFDITYYNDCSKCDADFWAIISIIASLHGFLLYYTVIKALELEGYVRFVVIMWQVVFSVSAATSSIDIYIYAKGNIGVHEEWKNKKKDEVPLEEVKVVANEPEPKVDDTVRKPVERTAPAVVTLIPEGSDSEDSDSAEEDSAEEDTIPYCDTCYDDYSNSRIPRILTKCGHTICEECAKGLLRENAIRCPYCKKITLVNGSASLLPKNFALMDIVERETKKSYVE